MARIWQEIEIDFKGETYTLRPTLSFINHLEQGPGNSISMLYARATQGDLPTGKGCEVIAKTLNFARKEDTDVITPEDVLEELTGVGVEFVTTVATILLACMPEPKKKAAKTTGGGKKKPAPRKSTRKRTGQNSTG